MNRKIFYNDQVFRSPSLPGDPGDLPGLQPPGVRLGTYQAQLSQEPTDRAEYYAVRPRRSREAYKKQYDRSASAMPEHCRLVEEVLAKQPEGIVQRVHVKGDSNATADNAHVIVIIERRSLHVVLGRLHHWWELPVQVLNALLAARGPKRGSPAIFNKYVASYQHDWEDATFTEQDYGKGYR